MKCCECYREVDPFPISAKGLQIRADICLIGMCLLVPLLVYSTVKYYRTCKTIDKQLRK